jgi:ATPase subunit of ABC transporter with duplicated ATPase domains
MISISGLGKTYGDRTLFANASLQLNAGERYGLVGANGSGKTTLLNILSGFDEPSAGSVSIPNRLRLGVLRQDQFLYEDEPILDVTMMGNRELWQALVEHDRLLQNAHGHFDSERYSVVEETIMRYDGYTAESRAATILEGLGLPAVVHRQPLSTLSGGFKLRVLLAQVLASAPDVLLLDEPTNHLDILSIRWLEGFIREFAGPVVVISHDHQFLDGLATHILDVDYQQVTLYHGNYTKFVTAKQEERERREKEIAGQKREIAQTMEFVERFKAKASKARQAQSKLLMVERKQEQMVELPTSSRRYPKFRLNEQRHSGRDVLKLNAIAKSYGEKQVLNDVNLVVKRGDRLAIMGPNGIGKSTLLKIAVGEVALDAGTVEWGYETYPGYFAQDHHEDLETLDLTVEQWVTQFCPDRGIGYVRGELALTLFTGDDPKKQLSALSGGEAARLVFTRLAIEKPNVLVLDEPTNHLDLESIEALVEGLRAYPGTLIFVSHDRWFINQLATRIIDIEAGGIVDYQGSYDEYVAFCGSDRLDADQVVLAERRKRAQNLQRR